MSPRRDHLRAVSGPDDAADAAIDRWKRLLTEYPEASYTFNDGWFYGSLREADDVLRAYELDWLINRLMAREHNPDAPI